MSYELIETETGNLVGAYRTQNEALEVVRQAVAQHGPNSVLGLVLNREDALGRVRRIARGRQLERMAHGAPSRLQESLEKVGGAALSAARTATSIGRTTQSKR